MLHAEMLGQPLLELDDEWTRVREMVPRPDVLEQGSVFLERRKCRPSHGDRR
jgi:hypothetical protein